DNIDLERSRRTKNLKTLPIPFRIPTLKLYKTTPPSHDPNPLLRVGDFVPRCLTLLGASSFVSVASSPQFSSIFARANPAYIGATRQYGNGDAPCAGFIGFGLRPNPK
ncbi:hypothetical protein, partial [Aliiruegeria haliotis]|uniref:hypothetical protein n=1 Tax=Aliiruegeria haliotis TaxID=1280846 RepID=UPI001B80626D